MEFASRCCTLLESVFLLLRCERGDNFLKTRIATQRVPVRVQFKNAVAESARRALHRRDLFDRPIFLTSPGVDLRQINGSGRSHSAARRASKSSGRPGFSAIKVASVA